MVTGVENTWVAKFMVGTFGSFLSCRWTVADWNVKALRLLCRKRRGELSSLSVRGVERVAQTSSAEGLLVWLCTSDHARVSA
jgi:hypothetical protein